MLKIAVVVVVVVAETEIETEIIVEIPEIVAIAFVEIKIDVVEYEIV